MPSVSVSERRSEKKVVFFKFTAGRVFKVKSSILAPFLVNV